MKMGKRNEARSKLVMKNREKGRTNTNMLLGEPVEEEGSRDG